ncbi:MAG: hypothetical protein V1776_04925 [Candidatus Diapherotrites archaeon]
MGKYLILNTPTYTDSVSGLSSFEKERIGKIIDHLAEQGDKVGKPLSGLSFFREKKFNGNRLYFLVYPEWTTILVVAVGPKKVQQKIIREIILRLPEYKIFVRKILLEKKLT